MQTARLPSHRGHFPKTTEGSENSTRSETELRNWDGGEVLGGKVWRWAGLVISE